MQHKKKTATVDTAPYQVDVEDGKRAEEFDNLILVGREEIQHVRRDLSNLIRLQRKQRQGVGRQIARFLRVRSDVGREKAAENSLLLSRRRGACG